MVHSQLEIAFVFIFILQIVGSISEKLQLSIKAIPIKCLVSHRPTDPFFSKSKKKKKSRFGSQRSKYFNLQAHDLVLLTTIGMLWSLSLINMDTRFFKGC